jgi:hypothetical protein
MEELFPRDYPVYKRRVPLFFPSYFSTWPHQKTRFRWERFKKNRELRAIIASALFWLIMTAKFLFY